MYKNLLFMLKSFLKSPANIKGKYLASDPLLLSNILRSQRKWVVAQNTESAEDPAEFSLLHTIPLSDSRFEITDTTQLKHLTPTMFGFSQMK